ncbi:hypothetical protein ELY37_16850 [Vreelandella populi]|uniref:Uncharacterized protein n=1 Tax=Vreelandella populi TaxID=2498858 RepID=A0A3S1E5A6_9GAMM|nr:hypothetical protein ELY37_16850 [Halomonas populi]
MRRRSRSGKVKNNVDTFFYPDIVMIEGMEFGAQKNSAGKLLIPCGDMPDIDFGKIIEQKIGNKLIPLKITDYQFREGHSLGVGTNLPNMLELETVNTLAEQHKPKTSSSTVNIGSITSDNVQIGDHNVQLHNATIKEIVEHVSKSDDPEAKSKLKSLLENPTVSSLVGAGVTALLAML